MKKILVANRGEIALRVMRSAKAMGIKTVAVFSEADRLARHVRFADEAVCLGPAPSKESYLRIDKIIEAAKALDVDAIHPGYGFLSENANFAKAVTDAGIIFIGPSSHAIEVMGSKLAAKQAVSNFDVPLVPGTDQPISDVKEAIELAKGIGFPILIKASAGGGGKGMRLVENAEELEEQMQMAISEAQSAFGDGSVFIEKFVTSPRHIEIQILGDSQGNIVHLFERECSIQRRHQKVVEEAPSAVVSQEMRTAMGDAAIKVAKAVNYVGAGTVEFIVDEQLNFFFLEMNTRLQVEHPVTEMITGVDLVKEQIRIAQGLPISFQQEDLKILGHAIELRVYAEDPENNFLPDIGKLTTYRIPEGANIRVDDGMEEGQDIPIYYDPMIAKLAVFGNTRDEAIKNMLHAIEDYKIVGAKTTLPFGTFVMKHPAFISGDFDTRFVENYFKPNDTDQTSLELAALLASKIYHERNQNVTFSEKGNLLRRSKWLINK
ncbi:MAG TPA: acetyl-CoA carboxylase biotin carboxylase subunit [Chitinophagales bacterium]|nr:acetyl-CoA carboxylase biotin carboxylase subunit [Chitinophagales bacterium]